MPQQSDASATIPLPGAASRAATSAAVETRLRYRARRRIRLSALTLGILAGSCASPRIEGPPEPARAPAGPAAEIVERGRALGNVFDAYGHPALPERRFTHAELWSALEPVVDDSPELSRELLGHSVEGREIRAIRYGSGPTRVLLWSQMHGDESTATRALLDLFHFLATEPDHPVARRLSEALTLEVIPMLNPDGAERFRRRNAQGIDVNRDARALQTPEGRILRETHLRFDPHFGFNLHDQNVRTRVGQEDRIAAIALLAPAYDEARSYNEVRTRAKGVAAVMRDAVEPFVADHITQYNDAYGERAFGDSMQRWGTSTVLLEAGGWRDDPEKSFLRKVNFVAITAALESIASGSFADADPERYTGLPFNGPGSADLLVRGGTVVPPEGEPFVADLTINYARPLQRVGGSIADIGDMEGVAFARDTLDVEGLFVHLGAESVEEGRNGISVAAPGLPARFIVREGREAGSDPVWFMTGDAPAREATRSP